MKKSVFVTAVALALFVSACGRDGSAPSDNDGMHITLPNPDLTLLAGTSANVRIDIVRNGFTGPLMLRAEGLPGGVAVADVTVGDDETDAVMIFTASAGAPAGVTHVGIRADAGVDSVSPSVRELRLTIRPQGSFSLSADPLSLVPGTTASTTVSVNRTGGFSGTVSLVASAPPGIVATLQPGELTGSTSTSLLGIIAEPTTRPGAYFVRITASSAGFVDETIDVIVTVTGG